MHRVVEAAEESQSEPISVAQPLALLAVVAAAIVAVSGALYVASSRPPYGFYYDLGGNILATALISHWVVSVPDAIDAVGWAGWGNINAFPYHPMLSVVLRLPLVPLFHGNVIVAMKFVQVLEVVVAVVSMAVLYATFQGWSAWAWIAGLIYALLPESLMMYRGNVDFGLAVALAPLCIGIPHMLVRRYGDYALPLCGAIIALLSSCIVLEFLFVQGIPAYAFAVAFAYGRRARWSWAIMSSIGGACFLLAAAYFIIPSLYINSFFSLAVPEVVNLQSGLGGGFTMFSETPIPFLALTIDEFFNASNPDFSLQSLLWVMLPAGIVLWGLAVWRVIWGREAGASPRGELPLALMGGICAVLSLGAWSPAVRVIWSVIAHIPLLNNMRTPDRLLSPAVLVVVLFAVFALESLGSRGTSARRVSVACSALLVAVGVYAFFWTRVFLGDPTSLEYRFPHLQAVNAIASERGGRVANLGEVYLGRSGDSVLYGMPQPYDSFQDDFFQRYESDGFGGSEILARAGVRTFVTTPRWATDSPFYPEPIAHSIDLRRRAGDPSTASVWAVTNPRADIAAVNTICLRGGPGLFEYALALPIFTRVAFATDATCTRTLYANSAPLDSRLGGRVVAMLSGITLFPHSGQMRDNDYRIANGRWFVNLPWYRNAIDGDSPELGVAAVALNPGNSGSASFDVRQSANYTVALRMVCHRNVTGLVHIDSATDRRFICRPNFGFQWIASDVGRLSRGRHFLRITIGPFGTEQVGTTSWNTSWTEAFDGAALVRRGSKIDAKPTAYLFSIDRFTDSLVGSPVAPRILAAYDRKNLFPKLGRVELKANTLYTVAFSARASVANTGFTSFGGPGVMITPTAGFPTSYPDTAWHPYSFDWLIGPNNVRTSVILKVSRGFTSASRPAVSVAFATAQLRVHPIQLHDFRAMRWISAGSYLVQTRLLGGSPGGTVAIDGWHIANGGHITIRQSREHALSYIGLPQDAYVIALIPENWIAAMRSTVPASVVRVSRQRWGVDVRKTETLEATVFPDGWWFLRGTRGIIAGKRCDIVNTCFSDVPPGSYLLAHEWPSYVIFGLLSTLAGWVTAIVIVLVAKARVRGTAARAQ